MREQSVRRRGVRESWVEKSGESDPKVLKIALEPGVPG
jgi:hypothetical protein